MQYLLLFVDGYELVLVGIFPGFPGALRGPQRLSRVCPLWRLRVRSLQSRKICI
jgi:hypothetical protein